MWRPAILVKRSHNLASSSSSRRFSSSSWLFRADLRSGVSRPEGSDWRLEEVSEVSWVLLPLLLEFVLVLVMLVLLALQLRAAATSSSSRRCRSRSRSSCRRRATSSSTAFAIYSEVQGIVSEPRRVLYIANGIVLGH